MEELTRKGKCIIIGDFNIDMLVETFYSKKLKRTLIEMGMKQYIKDPTRVTAISRTLIDYFRK